MCLVNFTPDLSPAEHLCDDMEQIPGTKTDSGYLQEEALPSIRVVFLLSCSVSVYFHLCAFQSPAPCLVCSSLRVYSLMLSPSSQ